MEVGLYMTITWRDVTMLNDNYQDVDIILTLRLYPSNRYLELDYTKKR